MKQTTNCFVTFYNDSIRCEERTMFRSVADTIVRRSTLFHGKLQPDHITTRVATFSKFTTTPISLSGGIEGGTYHDPQIDGTQQPDWNPISPQDMPYMHHGKRPRYRNYTKFQSPRKRASLMYQQIQNEAIQKNITTRPKVWNTKYRVGDAIEIENIEEGGVKATRTEKIRGVVLGIFRKQLDHTVLIRDVVFGEPVETRVPLHSPLVKSIKLLEKNFVHKGKKKVKRAKLYYLSERNPNETQVTKW